MQRKESIATVGSCYTIIDVLLCLGQAFGFKSTFVVAHGRVVTSSNQITEVKQCRPG